MPCNNVNVHVEKGFLENLSIELCVSPWMGLA